MASKITRIEWSDLYGSLANGKRRWKPGEHLSVIGPTQAGKTYLMTCLFPLRQYLTLYVSKAEDRTLSSLQRQGFKKLSNYLDRKNWEYRILLWPQYEQPGDEFNQYHVFHYALMRQFRERGWTVAVDEVAYFVDLKLDKLLSAYWRQGSSLKLSLMGATQRPSGVPLLMYGMPHHLFFFRYRDERDIKRIAGIGYLDRKDITEAVSTLGEYEFLYIHVPSGYMAVSKAKRSI